MTEQPTYSHSFGALVAWCFDHPGHDEHVLKGARPTGWYVLTSNVCLRDTRGPYPTEAEAQVAADAYLAGHRARRAS